MWITLTGFMASGKSTVSQTLGLETNRPVLSLDELAVARAGCSLSEFFPRYGEEAFRDLELELIRELGSGDDLVLDAGGGLVENPAAVALVRSRGPVVWLDAPWDVVRGRLQGNDDGSRPLVERLGWGGLEDLYHRRSPLYAQAADFRLAGNADNVENLAHLAGLRCAFWGKQNPDRES